MKIIGLTGGIASGKNLIAEIFVQNGAVVFDADAEVHKLLESDKSTIQAVKKNFPESFVVQKINRKILGKIVFADEKKLRILEKILHPKVRKNCQEFLKSARAKKKKFAVLNIPLLLETRGYKCDYIVAIITKKSVQKKRFLVREKQKNPAAKISELEKKFSQIISKQISNLERKARADFVIKNDGTKDDAASQVKKILSKI
jgi:dephospho-CoA kinase